MSSPSAPYFNLVSPEYLESLEEQYRDNPDSLPLTWRLFFDGMDVGRAASHGTSNGVLNGNGKDHGAEAGSTELAIINLIEAYRTRGHWLATIDPLNEPRPTPPVRLDLKNFGLEGTPADQVFQSAQLLGLSPSPLPKILEHLKTTYCGNIGAEISYVTDDETRTWLTKKMESVRNKPTFSQEAKKAIFTDLARATLFEEFIHKNYLGQKRFSLEGGEALVPALNQMLGAATLLGVDEVVVGMAHRGRLSVLTNVIGKPYSKVFTEFEGLYEYEDGERGGDVKYHLGYSKDHEFNGKTIHTTLAFNPSHLEAVNPVATGAARAKQDIKGGALSTMPLLIHGDAAVIGQGIVVETMNMMDLEGYCTGGTLHVVINNQVGFTTSPVDSRSSYYCTDFAKGIEAPVLHVNGNDAEAVVYAMIVGLEYRCKFAKDIFVDIVCYRKYGHNEGDEPRFTQPLMYEKLKALPNPLDAYVQSQSLQGELATLKKEFFAELEDAFQTIHGKKQTLKPDWFKSQWEGYRTATESEMLRDTKTGIPKEQLKKVIETIHAVPAGFEPLPKLKKMILDRSGAIETTGKVDWAVGELAAYGALIQEGYSVRLTGQDAKRGTFSHRHAELRDQHTGKAWQPLKALETASGKFEIFNSPLSEYGVMGFDYGYSLTAPKTLTIWEAQFGDFVNGAQIIIDQFLTSTEAKWHRTSGLVLLLPHGFEGQGPEHSSARLERFLTSCARGNIQVAYPTTPAQMAHLLRRQVLRDFRKPLIVMTPKSPLRMPEVVSDLAELVDGSFKNLLVDGPKAARRVIICAGKIYWDLKKEAEKLKLTGDTAFIRVEQLYPLDKPQLETLHKEFSKATDWIWAQEEPQNNGAWGYFRLATLDMNLPLRYVGRSAAPSVATGSNRIHAEETEALLKDVFKR